MYHELEHYFYLMSYMSVLPHECTQRIVRGISCCSQIFLSMVVTRSGVTGGFVANHAEEESSIAFVLVLIPDQKTEEEIATY